MKYRLSINILILILGLVVLNSCSKGDHHAQEGDHHAQEGDHHAQEGDHHAQEGDHHGQEADHHHGQGTNHHGKGHWMAPAQEAKKKNPITVTKASLEEGKKIYLKNCAQCHGIKGNGKGPAAKGLNPPPADYTDYKMMSMHSDGDLFWKIGKGRGAMPSFKESLSDTDRWSVVNYINTFAKKDSVMGQAKKKENIHKHEDGSEHKH